MKTKLDPRAVYSFIGVEGASNSIIADENAPDALADGESYEVEIEIFREGQFHHPWWGELNFDLEYLQGMVDNFDAKVIGQDVAFDKNHRPGDGAVAWVKGLRVSQKTFKTVSGPKTRYVLFATVDLNKVGYYLLKNKIYKYFSSEIHPNFTTHDKHNVQIEEGEATDTTLQFGATLIGGGITNRPFITHLGEIELSTDGSTVDNPQVKMGEDEDGTGIAMFCLEAPDGGYTFSDGAAENFDTPSDPIEEQDESEEPVEESEEYDSEDPATEAQEFDAGDTPESQGEQRMKLSQVFAKVKEFSDTSGRIEYLEGVQAEFSDNPDEAQVVDNMLELERKTSATEKAMSQAVQRQKAAESRNAEYEDQLAQKAIELTEAREGRWQSRVKEFAAQLRSESHHEAPVKAVEEFLLSVDAESRGHKFSVLGEGDESEQADLLAFAELIFGSIPEDSRMDTSENLTGNKEFQVDPNGGNAGESPEEGQDSGSGDTDENPGVAIYTAKFGEPDESIIPAIKEDGSLDFSILDEG